jgi:hypothetical protein
MVATGDMMDRQKLWDAMVNGSPVIYMGKPYTVQSIELEDGSGYNFNVQLYSARDYKSKHVFIRCNRPAPLNLTEKEYG